MWKKWISFTLLLLSLWVWSLDVQAETEVEELDPEKWVHEQLQSDSFNTIGEYWGSVKQSYGEYLPDISNKNLTDFIKDDAPLSIMNWIKGIGKYLLHELLLNGKLLGSLILLTLFAVILQTVQNAFDSKSVNKIAYAVVYLVLITLALSSF